jgi:hypothetical protein
MNDESTLLKCDTVNGVVTIDYLKITDAFILQNANKSNKFLVKQSDGTNVLLVNTANGSVSINDYVMPTADGTANQIIATDGSGVLSFVDASSSTLPTDMLGLNQLTLTGTDNGNKLLVSGSSGTTVLNVDTNYDIVTTQNMNIEGATTVKDSVTFSQVAKTLYNMTQYYGNLFPFIEITGGEFYDTAGVIVVEANGDFNKHSV